METHVQSSTKRNRRLQQQAFYAANHKTSAEIISDARQAVKAVSTRRPFTPLEGRRPPRPDKTSRGSHVTPPSTSVHLSPLEDSSLTADETQTNDASITNQRLQGLLPSPPKSSAPQLSSASALMRRRASLPRIQNQRSERRVQSGPKERTSQQFIVKNRLAKSPSLNQLNKDQFTEYNSDNQDEHLNNHNAIDRRVISSCQMLKSSLKDEDFEATENALDNLYVILTREASWHGKRNEKIVNIVLDNLVSFIKYCWPDFKIKACKLILQIDNQGKCTTLVCRELLQLTRKKIHMKELLDEDDIYDDIISLVKKFSFKNSTDSILDWTYLIQSLCQMDGSKSKLYDAGCIGSLATMLKKIASQLKTTGSTDEKMLKLSIQICGALRCLADIVVAKKSFISSGLLKSVFTLCHSFLNDVDFILNVAGMLSKLTQNGDCVLALIESECDVDVLFKALSQHSHDEDIAVRIGFIFGNLAAKADKARQILSSTDDHLDILASTATYYLDILLLQPGGTDDKKAEDIVVKVVRVLANTCIDETGAQTISNCRPIVDVILRIINNRLPQICSELFVNCCVALNNISYYANHSSYFMRNELALTGAVCSLVMDISTEVSSEAIRVLGNLTQSPAVRQQLRSDKRCLEWVVCLLDSSQNEMVFSSCGVLVNLMIDRPHRNEILTRDIALSKLIEALSDFGPSDWQLAGLMCQILANYTENMPIREDYMTEDLLQQLLSILDLFLDDSFISKSSFVDDSDEGESIREWVDYFVPVAKIVKSRFSEF